MKRAFFGALIGGAAGLAVAFVLIGLMVSGSGAAQGIADLDVTPAFVVFGSIGAIIGGVAADLTRHKVRKTLSGGGHRSDWRE